jgi:putative ABC transport system ATP-binding protein
MGSGPGTADGSPFLDVQEVWKTYQRGPERVRALSGVSLSLRAGEVVALVGRSGSGKTTLLNVVCGWERPDRGEVVWKEAKAGQAMAERPWSDLAIVPQGLGLLEELSIEENVGLPLRLARAGFSEREFARRPPSLLKALGLDRLADRTPGEVSMGEQQRAALARALVLVPTLLLADEPTGHQDEGWARGVFELLRLASRRGVCCLVATHNPEAVRFADRVLHIRDGMLTAEKVEAAAPRVPTQPPGGSPVPRGRMR